MPRYRATGEIARDRKVIAKWYLQGKSQYEIADLVGLSQATISRDLKALHKVWLKSSLVDFGEAKAKELAKIDHLELTYWEAWEASKTSTTIRGASDSESAIVTQKEGAGDPAFLAGVERCIKQRVDILGLNSPKLMGIVDEDFDQAEWANARDARHARAVALLKDDIEDDNGEDQ